MKNFPRISSEEEAHKQRFGVESRKLRAKHVKRVVVSLSTAPRRLCARQRTQSEDEKEEEASPKDDDAREIRREKRYGERGGGDRCDEKR